MTIEYARGDTRVARIPLTDTSGEEDAALDLSGKTVTVTCRKKNASGAILYQHFITVDGAGSVTDSEGMALETDAEAGVIVETITSTESAEFAPGAYKYDLEIRTADDPPVVSTPILGADETVLADYTLPPG